MICTVRSGEKSCQSSDWTGGARGLTLLTLDRSLDRHWDIDVREIGSLEDRRSGNSIVKTLILSEPSIWGDRCQKSEESGYIGT
jgi:hypothetical protein